MKRIVFALALCILFCGTGVFALEPVYVEAANEENLFAAANTESLSAGMYDEDVYEELEERIVAALENKEDEIYIRDLAIDKSEILNVLYFYKDVVEEYPCYQFYMELDGNYKYNAYENVIESFVIKYKNYSKEEINQMQTGIDKATKEILLLIDDDMTDFQKVMTVHDYMVLNYEYDTAVNKNPHADVVRDITMMITKKGVCMGYAYAFKHMMNILDIDCRYVESEKLNHMWNLVEIDDEWYHIDVTFDDPLLSNRYDSFAQVHHNYALLSTEGILKTHSGFAIEDGVAQSKLYDNAPWRDSKGAIAVLDGVTYFISGDDIIDENGKHIYNDLAGADGRWNIGGVYFDDIYAGLASYYGKLYFNTDTAIYSYDPETEKAVKILDYAGICGLFISGDVLAYGKYDIEKERFVKAGDEDISYMRVDEKLVANVAGILATGKINELSEAERTAANLYTGDEADGIVKINIKDMIQMAKIIASTK